MPNTPGSFIWYELMTSDPDDAERFYDEVIGWRASRISGGGMEYRLLSAGAANVAGLMSIPEPAAGAPPAWFGYLWVADADAAVEEVLSAGGSARMPATDIPGVGRIAMLADPQGVVFYVIAPAPAEPGESTTFAPGMVGHAAWNELATGDVDAALAFYTHQFGWTRGEPMPMGETGRYEILLHGGEPIGGAMARAADGGLPSAWSFYFRVPDIEKAADRIRAGGGRLLFGPAEVPGNERVLVALDPQGASFGLVAAA